MKLNNDDMLYYTISLSFTFEQINILHNHEVYTKSYIK